jgi:Putative DNA-binding domain
MRTSLLARDDAATALMLPPGIGADRLNIYRNTFIAGLTRTLRLAYPAVDRLVGTDFFDGAAGIFIAQCPPRMAWLDHYGAEFPDFLQKFEPAASLAYLSDVARLEWAVNRAIHAPDIDPLDLARLGALAPEEQARICFVPHPAVTLLRADHPVDAVWRAVLDRDDAALAAIDIDAGSVHLLVERRDTDVEVSRLAEPVWRFAVDLCAGRPIEEACAATVDIDAPALLAQHLAAGRFAGFRIAGTGDGADEPTTSMAPQLEALT